MDYTDLGPAMAEAAARIGDEKNANSIEELALRVAKLEEVAFRQIAIVNAIEERLREHMFPCQ